MSNSTYAHTTYEENVGISLVVQCLGVHLPGQGTQVLCQADICKASHMVDVSHSGIKPRFVRLQTSRSFLLVLQSHLCQSFHTVIQ